jgi:hypothetical protein
LEGGVKLVTEYLEQAAQFERMASETHDPAFKESLLKQAEAYRKMADQRSKNFPPPQSS